MKIKTKIIIIKSIGLIISVFFGISVLVLLPINDWIKLIASILVILIVFQLFVLFYNELLMIRIEKSNNPRGEFWILFRQDLINKDMLDKMPAKTYTIEHFSEEYLFYDKKKIKNNKRVRLQLSTQFIKFRDPGDMLITYSYDLIKDFKVQASIELSEPIDSEDSYYIPKLVLEIKRKDFNLSNSCDLMDIDCEIDELEQIIEYFRKTKIVKTPIIFKKIG